MNRLFHAKILLLHIVLLFCFLCVVVYSLWNMEHLGRLVTGICVVVNLNLMVICVEKMINTTYTITADERLIVHNGRFSKDIEIKVSDIKTIEKTCRFQIGGLKMLSAILIVTNDGHKIYVRPVNETDFIKKITRIKNNDEDEED